MKILYVLNSTPNDSNPWAGIFVKRQIDQMLSQNSNVYFVEMNSNGTLFEILNKVKNYIKEYKRINPDIVHCQYGSTTAFLTIITSIFLPKSSIIISVCGSDLYGSKTLSSINSKLSIIFTQISCLFANKCICKSNALKMKLWVKENTVVIPNGVNLDEFKPINKTTCKQKLKIDQDTRYILFNKGNNPRDKRLDLAQNALNIAKLKSNFNIELLILDNVSPNDVVYFINASDCLLITSDHEGSPNIVKEALACNLPIISVPCGDVVERLENVFPSCIVDREPEKIADEILTILTMNKSSNGRKYVSQVSIENISEKLNSLYKSIL